ncbi:CAAX protease [Pseudomonas phoenicis]|uniref:CAAX protease n=1 Tax=unclassified Pseudomonas TaxID=196821 RepID=UPI0039A3EF7E
MPHTVRYRPQLIDQLISAQRIASYSKVFTTKSDAELVGVYLWNAYVCAAFYPLLCTVEVTLRNAIDTALTADLGKYWWKKGTLQYKSFALGAAKAPYPLDQITGNFAAAFNSAQKDRSKRMGKRFKGKPDHHEIVAKTEFSTWEFILENEFMGNNLIWPKHLGKVFRGTWPTSANMLLTCKDRVALVRTFRNRIFHHEPAWKRSNVTNEKQAVAHLHEKAEKITELVSWISPEKIDLLEKSGVLKKVHRACSLSEIERFKYLSQVSSIDSMAKFVEVAEAARANDDTVRIHISGTQNCIYELNPI